MSDTHRARVLIVDDSEFMRRLIADELEKEGSLEIVGQAADRQEALQLSRDLKPDVVTLDLVMPHMSGMTVLERITWLDHPPTVLMVSAYTQEDTEVTLSCLSIGALDFILKPESNDTHSLADF